MAVDRTVIVVCPLPIPVVIGMEMVFADEPN